MSGLWAILTFLNNLWSAYKAWQDERAKQKLADALAKKQARDQAIDDSKKADTDADIFKSQSDIVNNKPG